MTDTFNYNIYHFAGGSSSKLFYWPGPCCSKFNFTVWQSKQNDLQGSVDTNLLWQDENPVITSSQYTYQGDNLVITVNANDDIEINRIEILYNGEKFIDYDPPFTFTLANSQSSYQVTVYDINRHSVSSSYSVDTPPSDTTSSTNTEENIADEKNDGSGVSIVGIAAGIIVAVVVLLVVVGVIVFIKRKKIFKNKSWY